jgi:hypothetical protein
MNASPDFNHATERARQFLINTGKIVTSESWQGMQKPAEMFEALDYSFKVPMYSDLIKLRHDINPNLPWADEHFDERVSGIPYNPPPSSEIWPYRNPTSYNDKEQFSHTYPERFWPKWVNKPTRFQGDRNMGLRYYLGDLDDVVKLLYREPNTRQAYLPVFFPEDTGAAEGQRVPCTLGYLFRYTDGYLHITYKIRSCDYFRHFRDDIYLAARLLIWVLEKLRDRDYDPFEGNDFGWENVQLGWFKMQIDSLHCFGLEKNKL